MSSARRSLLTATAAATLLGALWFVPSANATSESPARAQTTSAQAGVSARAGTTAADTASLSDAATVADTAAASGADDTQLADTGSFDTTPYVVGGTVFLSLGAGFVVYSVRRERLGF
ncbi:LPXTG cell wall anchor domain-containing protein [Streptomyces sp. NPDC006975]|uniref:LPXTG cell wall anchor domain-containing protein n=1 Tax=Streptomyces sp. NPDC006975 TaxID=3154310 RepID=UPI0034511C84